MLYYYECPRCKRRSDLLLKSELLPQIPVCPTEECTKPPLIPVQVNETHLYVIHCKACNLTSGKLILPTDAKGHYWNASGKHVPGLTFDPDEMTVVFGTDTTSDNIFNC